MIVDGEIEYDDAGNMTGLRGAREAGYQWEYAYGPQHWLSGFTDPVGNRTVINGYDSRGFMSQYTDGRGTRFSVVSNAAGKPTLITAEMQDGRRYARRYYYDALGRITCAAESNGDLDPSCSDGTIPKWWDYTGASPHDVSLSFTYDLGGRTTRETLRTNARTYSISTGYNVFDEPVTETMPSGLVIEYGYTNAGFMSSVRSRNRAGGNILFEKTFTYNPAAGRYDGAARTGQSDTYAYDQYGRMTGWERRKADGTLAAKEGYALNPLGQPVRRQREVGAAGSGSEAQFEEYSRDYLSRLVMMKTIDRQAFERGGAETVVNTRANTLCTPDNSSECYILGLSGNTMNGIYKKSGRTSGTLSEFVTAADESVTEERMHNNCSMVHVSDASRRDCRTENATVMTFRKDGNGNVTSVESGGRVLRSHIYDAWNRLEVARIYNEPTASGNKNFEIKYEYDPFGQISRRRVFEIQANGRLRYIEGQLFVWNGDQLAEFRHTTSTSFLTDGTPWNFVEGISGTEAAIYNQQTVDEHVRGMDGSLMGIRDANGRFIEWYKYSPYGAMTAYGAVGGAAVDNPILPYSHVPRSALLYRGFWRDPLTRLYFTGSGWYDSGRARYLTRDPSGPAVGRLNLYSFGGLDPVSP
jgi:RHS repeat-associated protein